MKKFILLLTGAIATLVGFSQKEFVVKAKINNPENYTLVFGYSNNGKFVADTNYTVQNGCYVFKGSVVEPVVASMGVRGNPALSIKTERGIIPGPSLAFFLTNEEIIITGEVNTIYQSKVEGGQANKEWSKIKKKEGKIGQRNWEFTKAELENKKPITDSLEKKRLAGQRMQMGQESMQLRKDFIKENPHSLVSMYFLSGMVNSLSLDELKNAYDDLADENKSSSYAKRIAQKIDGETAASVGKNAVPISKKDINGNSVNLQTLKGKYVLFDFWGSWCGPCRQSHPHLKEVYAKYKGQGLEIVGIAQETRQTLDECRKEWVNAIKKDDISWLQVLNNEDVDKFDAVKAYGVSAFPTKILLDKDGKIIARYLGEEREKFDQQLKEIFGN